MAATALLYPAEDYDRDYLALLAEKVVPKSKRPAHRPKDARPGTQIQPDSSDEEEEVGNEYGQHMDQDLWEIGSSTDDDDDDEPTAEAGSASTPAAAGSGRGRAQVVDLSSDEDILLSERAKSKRPVARR